MKPNSPIFESAFIRLIESFAHHFHKILNEFEDNISVSSQTNATQIIENIFLKFPRDSPQYLKLIQTLTKLASFDPTTIISDLSILFLNILNQSENALFQVLQNSSLIFKHGNIYHKEILTRFGIYLITDLICQILKEYGYNESCERLTVCSIRICDNSVSHKLIDDSIIKQWAVIFSFISETNFHLIFEMFKTLVNLQQYDYAFLIIQYVRLDFFQEDFNINFLSEIYKVMSILQKENKLTETILKSTSHLLQSQKKYCSPLDDIFDLSWNFRNDQNLQDEAISIICVLFPLLPSKKDQIDKFYEEYVLVNLQDTRKVKKKLHLFQILIYGIQYDPKWFCWEWGPSPRIHPYSYLRWNSQSTKPLSDPTSFLSIFMDTFYKEANFSVCYQKFSDILLQFAAFDFPFFIEKVMDSFLSVPNTDPRFVSFLMMIPKVNTPDFIDYSLKTVTFSDMGTFNEKVKSKVLDSLSLFTAEFLTDHGICGEQINSVKATVYSSDRKVEKRLEEWKFFNFQKTVIDHQITHSSCHNNTTNIIQIHLARCMPFIIPVEDYDTPEMMRLILQLSFNSSFAISSVAFPVCQSIITDDLMQIQFIEIILEYIKGPTSCESLFTCINLLNEMLISNPQELPVDVLYNIEFAAIRGSVSVHPSCRLISLRLLKMVNIVLGGHGCFNFIELNFNEIQKVANRKLFSHYLSDQNTTNSSAESQQSNLDKNPSNQNQEQQHQNNSKPSNKLIKFDQAGFSHYYDIWLYFVSEIANIIVSVNYTPLLDRFRTNLDCYIRALISANTDNLSNTNEKISDDPIIEKKLASRSHFYSYPDLSSGDITTLFTPTSSDSQMNVGLLTYYLAAHFNIEYLMKVNNLYQCQLHQPFDNRDESLQDKVVLTMRSLMKVGGLQKLLFSVLKHAHISLYPLLITMLSKAIPDQYENSAAAARMMLLSPSITPQFARVLFQSVIPFISVLEKFLIDQKVNSSSLIEWDNDMELTVAEHERLSIDFCIILGISLKNIKGSITYDELPLKSREMIFVFMINWITTKSTQLENLRNQAFNTLTAISSVGPIFTDSKLFDQKLIEIISKIEKGRSSILSSILYNHVELLLDTYIDSFYTQNSSTSKLVLLSLFSAFDTEFSDFLHKKSASLLLLGFIIRMRKDPQSFEFMSVLIDLITAGQLSIEAIEALVQMSNDNRFENGISSMINRYFIKNSSAASDLTVSREIPSMLLSQMSRSNSSNSISQFTKNGLSGLNWIFSNARKSFNLVDDSSPSQKSLSNKANFFFSQPSSVDRLLNEIAKQFTYATESVFQQAFKILKFKDLRISVKDVIDVLIIWSKNIHLHPNSSSCLDEKKIPPEFQIFTPYEFLDNLMKTTEIVGNSNISSMVSLWASLLRSPDHVDLIPNFLFDSKSSTFSLICRKGNLNQQILARLVSVEPEIVLTRLAQHCSFQYFYHVTVGLKKSFDNELWIVPLLTEAFLTCLNKEKLIVQIPYILHFALLFVDKGTGELLRALCSVMSIEIPDSPLSHDIIISIVKRFVGKFKAMKHKRRIKRKLSTEHSHSNTKSGKSKKTSKTEKQEENTKTEKLEKQEEVLKTDKLEKQEEVLKTEKQEEVLKTEKLGEQEDAVKSEKQEGFVAGGDFYHHRVCAGDECGREEDCIEAWGTEVVKWVIGSSSLRFATVSLSIFNQLLKPIEPLVLSGVCKSVIFHINSNRENVGAVSKLINESFIFFASVFEGNEQFALDYALSFIDCKLFVETCLDKAAKLFMKCLTSSKTSPEAWNSVVSMIRPFLPKLETDKKTQRMFEVLLKNHANEELIMIVLPIHLCRRELFSSFLTDFRSVLASNKMENERENVRPNMPSKSDFDLVSGLIPNNDTGAELNLNMNSMDDMDKILGTNSNIINYESRSSVRSSFSFNFYNYDSSSDQDFIQFDDQSESNQIIDSVLSSVSEIALCKALTFYSSMIGSASIDLMNSIFIVSSFIIKHISAESNKEPLEIIYKSALKAFPSCPNSIDFISAIVSFNLSHEKKNSSNISHWERSIDCVITSLGSLLPKDQGKIDNVTDCSSIQSVYNLLNCEIVPKILPFAEQQKMIDEMKLVVKNGEKLDTKKVE